MAQRLGYPHPTKRRAGTRVQDTRLRRGLTQRQVGLRVGVDQQHVNQWENRRALPRLLNAIRLARVLNTTVEDLFGHLIQEDTP